MSSHIPVHLARKVRVRANDCCEYCHLSQEWQEATFHIDHIKPKAAGGKTALGNLALACVTCSLRKGARVAAREHRSGKLVKLFNPRLDQWDAHFQLTSSFRLRGLTPRARVTIKALGMNRAAVVAIRRELSGLQDSS
jgi:5-methylcytosine-specific restriction endonuclease McrA